MSLPWTKYMPEVAMALSMLAALLGLGVAAYREHRQKRAHKLDRFVRIGFKKASRLGWLSTDMSDRP